MVLTPGVYKALVCTPRIPVRRSAAMSPPIPHYVLARRQANNLLPISRFPDEILFHIFDLNADYEDRRRFWKDFPAWTKLFHVCHRWYTIGLRSPLFWDTVTNGCGLEATRELLSRSQNVPLNVCVRFPVHTKFWNKDDQAVDRIQALRKRYEVPEELMKYMSRIKTLNIITVNGVWEPSPAVGEPTMLEVLTLNDCGAFNFLEDFDITLHWPFTVSTPKLRKLTITVERPLCGVIRIPTLRSLTLDLGIATEESGYKVEDVLESLRQMPQLEHVDIHYALLHSASPEEVEQLEKAIPVHLPNVKIFACGDCVPMLPLLLDNVVIPNTCFLSVACEAAFRSDIEATISSVRTKLTIGGAATQVRRHIRSLTISSRGCGGRLGIYRALQIVGCPHIHACFCADTTDRHAFGRDADCDDANKCDDACIRITIAYGLPYDGPWIVLDGLHRVLDILPLEEVQSLYLDGLDLYNDFKAEFDLIPDSDVATLPAPPDLATAGACHFALPSPGFELGAQLCQLMPHLASVCVNVEQRKYWELTLADDLESDDDMDNME
ncbi:hypothetical protein PHLGIDRAFT_147489 [Phlebiopsis gigantea 11061_1 CR5-6]|uniref:Uncharacterized protein n=1 Tax=Phlebiopsis gigantea (strain 11061_1 CR5-6) TaxID=745531 RepID=A0A0C3RVV5_PHLG1|nr:hypothetical protein PHLGIDRAFT_147489 [Phlebiopsis gigantea 11061_1 CR5-6]